MKRATICRPIGYFLVILGTCMLAAYMGGEIAEAVLGALCVLVIIPVLLVWLIGFYRTNDGKSRMASAFNVIFRIPLALFGCVSLTMGMGIIGWVLYNVLVEQQEGYTGPTWIMGFWSFGAGVPLTIYGWLTLRSVIHRRDEAMLDRESREDGALDDGEDAHAR